MVGRKGVRSEFGAFGSITFPLPKLYGNSCRSGRTRIPIRSQLLPRRPHLVEQSRLIAGHTGNNAARARAARRYGRRPETRLSQTRPGAGFIIDLLGTRVRASDHLSLGEYPIAMSRSLHSQVNQVFFEFYIITVCN